MKKVCEKIFVCALSVIVFSCALINSYIIAYATETTDNRTWYEKLIDWGIDDRLYYFACQFGAILIDHDLDQALANDAVWDEWLENYENGGDPNTDTISYDEATDSVTIDVSEITSYLQSAFGFAIIQPFAFDNTLDYNFTCSDSYVEKKLGNDVPELVDGAIFVLNNPVNAYVVAVPDGYSYEDIVFVCTSSSGRELDFYSAEGGVVYLPLYDVEDSSTSDSGYSVSLKKSASTTQSFRHYSSNRFFSSLDTDACSYSLSRSFVMCVYKPIKFWFTYTLYQNYCDGLSGYLGSRMQQIIDNGNKITVQMDDLSKDWEAAYNSIESQLDELNETAGSMPTEDQIDSVFDEVIGTLDDIKQDIGDIGDDIGDIGDDVEDMAKTLDDLYALLQSCYEKLSDFYDLYAENGGSGSGSVEADLSSVTSAISSLKSALDGYQDEDRQQYAALLSELQEISSLLSSGSDQDYSSALDTISSALSDIKILMNDRILALLEDISSEIDTSKLEDALDEVRQAIVDAGSSESQGLDDMKTLLADMQDVLIEIKSGIASQKDYSEALEDINDLLGKIYKVEKFSAAVDVADLLTDFAALLDDGDSSFLDRMGTSMSNVVNASQEHFPTSVPWDMILLFTAMNTDAVAPSYEIPFSMPALGVDETVAIDLSGFEQLSKVSRALLSVLFILLLIALTRKMCSGDGEGDG